MTNHKSLYHDILLDHYRNPRNAQTIPKPDMESGAFNPSCGDSIILQASVREGTIDLLVFQGKGCVISQATASLLTEYCKSKKLLELQQVVNASFIMELIGIELGPMRARCALLSLEALLSGISNYQKDHA